MTLVNLAVLEGVFYIKKRWWLSLLIVLIHKHLEVILFVRVALTETLNSFFCCSRVTAYMYMSGQEYNKLYVRNSYTEYAIIWLLKKPRSFHKPNIYFPLSAVNTTYSILTSKESTWHIYDPLRYVNAIRFLIREKPQLDPRNDYKEESAILWS